MKPKPPSHTSTLIRLCPSRQVPSHVEYVHLLPAYPFPAFVPSPMFMCKTDGSSLRPYIAILCSAVKVVMSFVVLRLGAPFFLVPIHTNSGKVIRD